MERGRNQAVDVTLMGGLRAGSSQAWAALYDRLAPGIHRFAVTCLSGDAETAEDVVVETLSDAARGIARFDPQRSSLSAWIYGIARRVVQTELRRRARQKSAPAWAQVSFEDLAELSGSQDLGARTAARLDAQRRVAELGNLLSDTERELLALSCTEELPVREVGRVVGRSEQATQMLLHRARKKARRAAIEGTLLVGGIKRAVGWGRYTAYSHGFTGLEDWRLGDEAMVSPELSRVDDEVVYFVHGPRVIVSPPVSAHIWKARRDGSGAVNLSEAAGLTSINMYPRWSPDGTMIAFVHWDEPGGEAVGPGEAWVMKADGSEARRAASKMSLPTNGLCWSPDGSRLLCGADEEFLRTPPLSVDLWGKRVQIEAGAYDRPHWSPDGSKFAAIRRLRGTVAREPGTWNQLLVGRADGSRAKVAMEQFIADAEVARHCPSQDWLEAEPAIDWREDLLNWAGPAEPTWSPRGDKIAFLAALPFPASDVDWHFGVDAWVYDLVSRRLTRITNEPHYQHSLSWR